MADQDLSRPAFRYSSSGRRPERLNQSRNVNAPLQLARGWAAGLLGLPGDIEGLVRMLPGIRDETPVLPTSDFYREYLPGYDPRPAARAVSGLGALAGGAGATNVVRGGLGAVKRAIDPEAIRQYVRATQGMTGLPGTAVVKPKGGNWLAGADSPEEAVRVLKTREPTAMPMNEAEMTAYRAQGYTQYNPETGVLSRPDPLNQWLDQKLAKYIRNEMGTPEDPLRALIQERGVSHLPLEQLQEGAEWLPESVALARRAGGFPEEGMALERHAAAGYPTGLPEEYARAAQGWEVVADAPITPYRAGRIIDRGPKEEHLPFIQDFVRSGRWGRVGDAQNAGVRRFTDVFSSNELRLLQEAGAELPSSGWLSGEDIQRLHNMIVPEGQRLKYDARGNIIGSEGQNYAAGGLVSSYDPARIDALADEIMAAEA